MLNLINVTKLYQQKVVLNDMSFNFKQQRYCIVGPNGSGKTTLLMLAAGIEKPDSGAVLYDDVAVYLDEIKKDIGVSSDRIVLPQFLTGKQLLEFHCSQHQCPYPHEYIEKLNFNVQLTTLVSALSLGNLKKISLLLAISHHPSYLLLDEPTTGLDKQSRLWLLDFLSEYSGQLIVTSHEECFVNNSDFHQLNIVELAEK
ncbi:ATP-binding cassette domain-containing protein [Litorilituus lipolyticus]|uniref:ABC transporter ATP-binding protein n=1 Tax=Litorilituus lipolyticus TaxID=2491017 RepID=A0A502L0W8_9GAMM|nr:ABC transporter ATP-binding protein [Litorilituus lipolyticus]TPH15573.1 ABC transporter ATP-binding protein [Litorilituus lipolyticus]